MSKRTLLLILLVFAMLAAACSDDGGEEAQDDPEPQDSEPVDGVTGGVRDGRPGALNVRLSQGEALSGVTAPVVAKVEGTPMDAAAVNEVLDRLPEWTVDEDDKTDFNRPAESLPPPLVGETIDVSFPAGTDLAPPAVEEGPLEVLRVQPVGNVGLAPFVSLTFNQPMVPLTTLDQLDQLTVPVTMTPEVPGRWQWIGTRTLRFEHDPDVFDRLPMATSYVVEVPAGTTSESGGVLAETVRVEFETPAPSVVWLSPQDESLDLEPIFIATFDQRVDPDAVLGAITLTADDQGHDLRLATDNEIAGDEIVQPRAEQALDGTWVAFRAVDAFEPDQSIEIVVGPNVPSAEGPNTNDSSSTYRARTYAPLEITDWTCRSAGRCRPGQGFFVQFNNPLDPESLDPAALEIDPALPGGVRIGVQRNWINIDAESIGGTEYEITIPGELADQFGQTLGDDETLTIDVDDAEPEIRQIDRTLVTIDPLSDGQTVPVAVRNHDEVRVRLYEVTPDDWETYQQWLQDWERSDDYTLPPAPWAADSNRVVDTDAEDNILTEVRVDMAPVLDGERGHVVMHVEGVGRYANLASSADDYWQNRPVVAWVQDTTIGVDMVSDYDTVAIWTTDLRTGEPLDGVTVELVGQQQSLTTDGDGLARGPIGSGFAPIVATLGDDTAINPTSGRVWEAENTDIWYVVDDRNLYRPGETMRVKGWVRTLDLADDATLEFLPAGELITWRAADNFDIELATGEIRLDEHGGFDFSVDIPAGANLGYGWIQFTRPGQQQWEGYQHSYQIEEFRRPEFEVTARAETPEPYFVDEPATVAVDAVYFSGGPLPEADVEWTVWTNEAQYSPPSWDDFTFGKWVPWWFFDDFYYGGFEGDIGFGRGFSDSFFPGPEYVEPERFAGVTDASGTHYLRMDFDGDGEGLPTTVTAEATVFDLNRQAWSSSTDVLVHPADLYVGLRATRTFVRAGEPLDVEAIVTDIDGNAIEGRIFTIRAERLVREFVDGEWTEVGVDAEEFEVTSLDGPVASTFAVATGGRYRISADVTDDEGRHSHSEMTRWVTGGDAVPNRSLELQQAEVIPDKEEYEAGDTAEILVTSPFSPATGLLTVARDEVVEIRTFDIVDHAAVLEIPITDDHVPNLAVQVEIVGATERTADDGTALPDVADRTAYASGGVTLRVPPFSRTLDVETTPGAPVAEPGATTSVDVVVRDADGDAVEGADVLLVVVDEAVLALSGYQLIDPIDVFYREVFANLGIARGRDTVLLEDPEALIELQKAIQQGLASTTTFYADAPTDEEGAADSLDDSDAAAEPLAPGANAFARDRAAAEGGDGAGGPIEVRQDFDALAVFDPDVATGPDGSATVDFTLPDSLTRYRVMAVAVDGVDHFGTGESSITARLPLQVRPSAPRFLNFGDDMELPLLLQNQTDRDMEVDVVLQTSNLDLDGPAGRRVTVPANNRVEVRFPASTESAGTARFRAAAVSTDHADAAIVSLPVYTPATAEAFATYGVIDDGAIIQSLAAPTGVFPQFGGLEVNTSSTAVQALTDAVLYLAEYPYRSSDAYASRIIAISALRPILEAFDAEGLPSADEIDATVQNDITELQRLQNWDGGFGWWYRDQRSQPYQSIQAVHALVVAEQAGYSVNTDVLWQGRNYINDIENRIPASWSQETKDMLAAYALHVRWLYGDSDSAKARTLWNRRGSSLGLDAMAWLWPVVADASIEAEIERQINNRATETAGAATFATDYGEDAYLILHSDRRTDGIVLDALIAMAPESELIPKTVTGLIGNQIRGRWNNVQENSFILLALNNYFETFEAVEPDFIARVWLGDLYAAEHTFEGRTTERAEALIPMAELIERGDDDVVVSKDGAGRLYYRLGLRYAPDDLDLDPLDRGFVVERSYEGVDDPADVSQDADGTWRIKAGAEVRVNLTMVNDSRRTNMALVDPMPAGLESLNPALAATTDDIPPAERESSWWNWRWYDHQNLRDDRVEAFAGYLWAGTHEYSYVARATTPGTFVVPPARAEEIYAPETFGRSGSDLVVVEDA